MQVEVRGDLRLLVAGNVEVPLSPGADGLTVTLAAVRTLNPAAQRALLADAGLTVPPGTDATWTYRLAASLVQNAWYQATTGAVPPKILEGHAQRVARFQQDATRQATAAAEQPAQARQGRPPLVYQATAQLPADLQGQQAYVAAALRGGAGTVETLTARVTAAGLTAGQPLARVVGYYLNMFRRAGWAETVSGLKDDKR